MGTISHEFRCIHLGRGIMVSVKDVAKHLNVKKACYDDIADAIAGFDDEKSVKFPLHWTVLGVCQRFLLLSPYGDESNVVESGLHVSTFCDDYNRRTNRSRFGRRLEQGTGQTKISVAGFPKDAPCSALLLKELVEAAQMLTGQTLRFSPGVYTLSCSQGDEKVQVLWPFCNTSNQTIPCLSEVIPRDVTIRMKDGETMEYNRSILLFYGLNDQYFPNFRDETILIEDPTKVTRTFLEECVEANASADISMNADCVFLVGSSEERLEVNRSVLAMNNDTLCRLVYGTKQMPADLDTPIPLPNFDIGAVKVVFEALMLRSNLPMTVPVGEELKVLAFLDYIDESPDNVGLHFEIFPAKMKNVEWTDSDDDDEWVLRADNSDDESEAESRLSESSMYVDSEEEDEDLAGFEPDPKVMSKGCGNFGLEYLYFSENEEATDSTNYSTEETKEAAHGMEE